MGLRQDKVARQIQKDLGELMQARRGDWLGSAFVTIAKVTITPDLGYVNVYLSLFNNKNRAAILEHINEQNKEIRHALAKKIKNNFRKIPELRFYEDDTLDEVERIEKLFDEINKKKED